MKTVLVGINSKYIHPNLAIRYLKANTSYPVDILEFTIKDSIERIIKTCQNMEPDVLGFSVYIWNVEIFKKILIQIKEQMPLCKIILGGPEVSYVNEAYLSNNLTDYIIVNEGEIAFNQLLKAIDEKRADKSSIPNLIYKDKDKVNKTKEKLIDSLDDLKDPYQVIDELDVQHKIQYVELSRGCPYKCSYCLASLEKGLRFFKLERVKDTIEYLIKKGARTFKFLDRSFNANHKIAKDFLEYIINQNYKNVVFQFEINGDVLQESFIDFLIKKAPNDLIRFELGIQSTNDKVNKAVNRYQDTKKLIENIKHLQASKVTLHLDLIAGLPYEDLESFKNTFNTIYHLFADELQLGFLKVLKGTDIYYKTALYDISYDKNAPYEIIENRYISKNDLNIIHMVETMLNIYWNKGFMNKSIQYITKNTNAFDFFHQLYLYYSQHQYSTLRYGFNDIFTQLIDFLKHNNLYDHTIESYLKFEFLNHHPIKPKIYWNHPTNKNDILRSYHMHHPHLNIDRLYKYCIVCEYLDGYLIVSYEENKKTIDYFISNL